MKTTFIIFLSLLSGCFITKKHSITSTGQSWSTSVANNTSKIKVTTTYYNTYEGLHQGVVFILQHLNFILADSTNPIRTKPKIIYNGVAARYFVTCADSTITITGDYVEPSIGGSADINATNANWKPILKGSDRFGTPWFEKMQVVAEAIKEGKIEYGN